MNLEELVRAALTTQASAEPAEADAYDRCLRHRRRSAWRASGSAVLAMALVLTLAGGGAWLFSGRHQGSVTGPATTTGPYTATMVFVVPTRPGPEGTSPDGAQRLASTYAGLVLEDDLIAQAVGSAVDREPAEVQPRLTAVNPVNTALIRVAYTGTTRAEALGGVKALQASLTGPKPVSPAIRPNSVLTVQEARVAASP